MSTDVTVENFFDFSRLLESCARLPDLVLPAKLHLLHKGKVLNHSKYRDSFDQ